MCFYFTCFGTVAHTVAGLFTGSAGFEKQRAHVRFSQVEIVAGELCKEDA